MYVDGLLNPAEVLRVRFLYFRQKEGYLLVVGGQRGYLIDHVDEVSVVFGLKHHFLVDCKPSLCESRMFGS